MTKSLRRSRNNATDQTLNSREIFPLVGPLDEAAPSREPSPNLGPFVEAAPSRVASPDLGSLNEAARSRRDASPKLGSLSEVASSRKTSTTSASSHSGPVRYDSFMSHGSYETFNYSGWMTASAPPSSLGGKFWQFRSLDTGSTQVVFGDPKAGLEAYQTMLAQQVCDPPTETASDSDVSSGAAGQ